MTEQQSEQLVGWVALCLLPRIGGRTLSALLDAFGSPNAVFAASHEDLLNVHRIGVKTIDAIEQVDLGQVAQQIGQWQAADVSLLTWQDAAYPTPLHDITDRPPLLFARGTNHFDWRRVVAIVGTREPTAQSAILAQNMARELTQRGWLVVSGLARGIDGAAHRGALESGQTVAMLGSGVDTIYPRQHADLGAQIIRNGAIFAEVPPGVVPSAGALMARNRLIAGVAKATIVIQAGYGSGSMEAARRARRQQRHVITLDDPQFDGNQALINMGATPLHPHFADWDGLAQLLDDLPDPPRQLRLFD